jgi:hypothetical protein
VNPILVDEECRIIAGHCRHEVAVLLGINEYLSSMSEDSQATIKNR